MPGLNTITFENHKIVVIIDNSNIIWFNAKQVCQALEYKHPKKAITNNVGTDSKIQFKNINITFNLIQQPDSIYINESGLYSLLISSKTKRAKKFVKWITESVLPSLRKSNVKTSDEEINKLLIKINDLELKNSKLARDLKLEKFPEGAMVYVIEETDTDGEIFYRIGKTDNMNKRIQVHNTHSLHNKKVVHHVELQCPIQLETCVRSMLYKYRYKNKKDYFSCSLGKIIKAFSKCQSSIKCVENQIGGSNGIFQVTYYINKLNEIKNQINLSTLN